MAKSIRERAQEALPRCEREPANFSSTHDGDRADIPSGGKPYLSGDSERVWFYIFARHDVPGFANALLRLTDPALRDRLINIIDDPALDTCGAVADAILTLISEVANG